MMMLTIFWSVGFWLVTGGNTDVGASTFLADFYTISCYFSCCCCCCKCRLCYCCRVVVVVVVIIFVFAIVVVLSSITPPLEAGGGIASSPLEVGGGDGDLVVM